MLVPTWVVRDFRVVVRFFTRPGSTLTLVPETPSGSGLGDVQGLILVHGKEGSRTRGREFCPCYGYGIEGMSQPRDLYFSEHL